MVVTMVENNSKRLKTKMLKRTNNLHASIIPAGLNLSIYPIKIWSLALKKDFNLLGKINGYAVEKNLIVKDVLLLIIKVFLLKN